MTQNSERTRKRESGGRLPPPIQQAPWCHGFLVADTLIRAGYEAWFVGGCVRDHLLGRSVHDVDVTTDATPEQVHGLFPTALLVGAQFGVVVVVTPTGAHVEVATYRTDGEYVDGRRPTGVRFATRIEDVRRRDFTINALLMDPRTGAIEDHVGGLEDLAGRALRVVGDPTQRLAEDRLRVLRGLRFAAHLDLHWDAASWDAAMATPLSGLSRERIWQEFDKALRPGVHGAGTWYRELERSGHRSEIDPDLPIDPIIGEALERMRAEDDPLLPWAIVFHRASPTILRRLAEEPIPRERIRRLGWLVQTVARLRTGTTVAQRRRAFQQADAEILVRISECLGFDLPARAWFDAERTGPHWRHPITANDLLALGLKPGRQFGQLLRELEDAALEDPTLTRELLLERASQQRG